MRHWTLAKAKRVKPIYQQTIGNLYLRSIGVDMLYKQLEQAKSSGHKKAIASDLRALGEGDYISGYDDGEAPKGAE